MSGRLASTCPALMKEGPSAVKVILQVPGGHSRCRGSSLMPGAWAHKTAVFSRALVGTAAVRVILQVPGVTVGAKGWPKRQLC